MYKMQSLYLGKHSDLGAKNLIEMCVNIVQKFRETLLSGECGIGDFF